MGLVFVNYRMVDTAYGAADVAASLSDTIGRDQVFLDHDSMIPGEDYPTALRDALERCDILVAVIGPAWLSRDGTGVRLVDRERDWVREEIAHALERGIPVVPVLLRDARQPTVDELPGVIRRFALCQHIELPVVDLADGKRRLVEALVRQAPALLVPRMFEADAALPGTHLPSALLRAEYEVVPFAHRETELDRLRGFLLGDDRAAALLMTGSGGQGKTRLARHLCAEVTADGWVAGFLADEVAPATVTSVCALETPMLLVIDYAEGRTEQAIAAMAAFSARTGAKGRLLLIGRSAGEWQDKLADTEDEAAAATLTDCAELPLPPLVAHDDRSAEFDRAVDAFARRLDRDPAGVGRPELDHRRYDNVLDIHAAALAVLLDDLAGVEPKWRDPVRRLLMHERKHWKRSVGGYDDVRYRRGRLDQVVAAATLCGAGKRASALRLLAALPTFAGEQSDVIKGHLEWCRDLYPGPGTLNGLRPDRLGEDHLARTLRKCPELATAVLGVTSRKQVRHALVVLGRTAPRRREAAKAIKRMLRRDPERMAVIGVEVAAELADPRPIVAILTSHVEKATGYTFLRTLADEVPLDTIALAEFGALAAREALAAHQDPGSADHAELLTLLGNRLVQLDEVDEAVGHLSAAAQAYEALAADGDEEDRAEWARSLVDLADALNVFGQFEAAVERTQEAVELLSALAAADRDSFGDDLVAALIAHAANLRAAEREGEAARVLADTVDEAERIGPELLANALHHQGAALGSLGRLREACAATERAAGLYRRLAGDAPDRFTDTYAEIMADLSGLLFDLGRADEGLAVSEEAVKTVGVLVSSYGRRFDHTLATALNNRGLILEDQGRHEDAERMLRDALRLFRSLATARSEVYQDHVGKALANRAISLRALGRFEEALDADTESVTTFRKLAGPASEEPRPDLIEALMGLYLDYSGLDRLGEAHEAIVEAVRLCRELVAANPDLGTPTLAAVLGNLAESWHALDNVDRAAGPADDSLRLYRVLAEDLPARYENGRAHMAQLLGILLSLRGRHRKAAHAHAEAIGLYRVLDGDNRPHLADIHRELAVTYLHLGDKRGGWHRAFRAADTAATIYRELIAEGGDYRDVLAGAVFSMACAYVEHSALDDALEIAEEAVAINERGHADEPERYAAGLAESRELRDVVAALLDR